MSENPRTEPGQSQISPRMQFRENRQRRQNMVFSVTVSIMAAVSLAALLVLSGILPVPFFGDFSKADEVVEADQVPCFPEGSAPANPEGIHVTIMNATGRPGLAGTVASSLEAQGVVIDGTGNYDGQYYGTVKLTAGKSQVINAYSLARVFDESTVRYAPSDPATVSIILGERFVDLPSTEEVAHLLSGEVPLKQDSKCKPIPESEVAE
ncbi:MAG: LytR C-terminal domain-containing protein [Actinomycetaceae bacterium]|nr:LytR C-terminal domain-containing protein [Actinomycetaceae bacterium]